MAYKNQKKNKLSNKKLHRGTKTKHKAIERARKETSFMEEIRKKMGLK